MEVTSDRSELIDPTEVDRAGSFTSLPVRRSHYAHIAEEASKQVEKDFARHFGEASNRSPGLLSNAGSYSAFVYAEALPERLSAMTYLTDVAFLHDDYMEALDDVALCESQQDFVHTMSVSVTDNGKETQRSPVYKRLLAQAVLDLLRMDRRLGSQLIEVYATWGGIVGDASLFKYDTLDDYVSKRHVEAGVGPLWIMIELSGGWNVSAVEHLTLKPLIMLLGRVAIFTNDYWSYEREVWMEDHTGARIISSIEVVLRDGKLTVDEAKAFIRRKIIEDEQAFLDARSRIFATDTQLSIGAKSYLDACAAGIGGNSYFCAISPRYGAWKPTADIAPRSKVNDPQKQGETLPIQKSEEDGRNSVASHLISPPDADPPTLNACDSEDLKGTREAKALKLDGSMLNGPAEYIQGLPSKSVRKAFIEALDSWLEIPAKSLAAINDIVNTLHNASLILDDIEDDSPVRRACPATHVVFGRAQSINSANHMLVEAIRLARQLVNPRCLDVILEQLEALSIGQSWDLHWKNTLVCPSEQEYLQMIDGKTGGMFSLISRVMQADSTRSLDLEPLTALLGRLFQIRDDYMNLKSDEYGVQKGICEDFDEGKLSYPIVMCHTLEPKLGSRILNIFRQQKAAKGTQYLPVQTKKYILQLMEKSMDATFRKLEELFELTEVEISKLERETGLSNPMMSLLIERLRVL